jgi:hypothetical protein
MQMSTNEITAKRRHRILLQILYRFFYFYLKRLSFGELYLWAGNACMLLIPVVCAKFGVNVRNIAPVFIGVVQADDAQQLMKSELICNLFRLAR